MLTKVAKSGNSVSVLISKYSNNIFLASFFSSGEMAIKRIPPMKNGNYFFKTTRDSMNTGKSQVNNSCIKLL